MAVLRAVPAPPHDLQQELEDLQVPLELVEVAAPRVEPVAADEEPVRRAAWPRSSDSTRGASAAQSWVFSMTGSHSRCACVVTPREPLQHLVALDGQAARRATRRRRGACSTPSACGRRRGRRARARSRGGGASPRTAGRRPPSAASLVVDRDHVIAGARPPLSAPLGVMTRRRGSRAHHRAEVAAGPQGPAARVRAAHDPGQPLGRVARRGRERHIRLDPFSEPAGNVNPSPEPGRRQRLNDSIQQYFSRWRRNASVPARHDLSIRRGSWPLSMALRIGSSRAITSNGFLSNTYSYGGCFHLNSSPYMS